MRQISAIQDPTEEEIKLITSVTARISEATIDLIERSVSPPELVLITVDDFRGLQWFSLDLSLAWEIMGADQRELIAKRSKCSLRDVWVYRGEGVSQELFGREKFYKDADTLQTLTAEWDARGLCEIDQKYRLWSIALTSAKLAKPKTALSGLPWIIENGFNDFAPRLCAIALNPNGEAQDYLKEVWDVA